MADDINKKARKYHHCELRDGETLEKYEARKKYEEEQEMPAAVSKLLPDLTEFLEKTVSYINNNISSIRGRIEFEIGSQNKNDTKIPVLVARLVDVDTFKDHTFEWSIKGGDKLKYKGPALYIKSAYIGKTVVCRAIHNSTKQIIYNEYTVKEQDLQSLVSAGGGNNEAKRCNQSNMVDSKAINMIPEPEATKPKGKPLLRASFLEAELAKGLLKTPEDYDENDD